MDGDAACFPGCPHQVRLANELEAECDAVHRALTADLSRCDVFRWASKEVDR